MNYFIYKVVRFIGRPIYKIVFRPKYYGVDNIPSEGAVILAGNHTNNLDAAMMIGAPKRIVHMMAKKELFSNKISNRFFRSMGCISVNRSIHDENAKSEAIDVLKNNEVIQEELPNTKIAVLSGPSHAEEVSVAVPTVLVVASKYDFVLKLVQDTFMSSKMRIYTSNDVKGVELGGALKNIIAFCAGVASALTYGKSLADACEIGSRLAASVITSSSNVCPRFLPEELGIEI